MGASQVLGAERKGWSFTGCRGAQMEVGCWMTEESGEEALEGMLPSQF